MADIHGEHRELLKDVTMLARQDLETVWPSIAALGDVNAARESLYEVLPTIGNGYGDVAATIGASYYEELAEKAGAPEFDPVLPDLPDDGRWAALSNWGTQSLLDDPGDNARWAVAMEKISGGIQRSVADQHRLTIVESSLKDPAAQGWSRVGVGDNCEFCNMLIGRGDVYTDATVTFRSHDHCNCSAAPRFSNLVAPARIFPTGLSEKGINPVPTSVAEAAEIAGEAPSLAGLLTAEQYASMLPDAVWSEEKRNAILAALRSSENGKVLADTLDKFQDGGSIARIRSSIDKRLAGEEISGMAAQRADAMIDALRHAPSEGVPEKLYRGMSISGSQKTVLGKYVPGQDLDLNLTSFSSDRAIATKFQKMTRKKGATDVMVELIGDDKVGIPIQNLARDKRLFKEKEWISAGKYEIVETKKSPSGGVIVRVKQKARIGEVVDEAPAPKPAAAQAPGQAANKASAAEARRLARQKEAELWSKAVEDGYSFQDATLISKGQSPLGAVKKAAAPAAKKAAAAPRAVRSASNLSAKDKAALKSVTPEASDKAKGAIARYTGDSIRINTDLRDGVGSGASDRLDEVLRPLSGDITTFRALDSDLLGAIKPGDTITDKGFLSTTIDESGEYIAGAAERFLRPGERTLRTVMEIRAKKGTKAAYVEKFSDFPGEHELVLGRNTKLRVVEIVEGNPHRVILETR